MLTERSLLVTNPDCSYKDYDFHAAPTPKQLAEYQIADPSTAFTLAVLDMLSNVYVL